jgi:hypothetical protein
MLLVGVWCAMLVGVAAGPIDYTDQPSVSVLFIVAAGLTLFAIANWGGARFFERVSARRHAFLTDRAPALNAVVVATSLAGMAGIAMIAIDRILLSGVDISYAELLRCAPQLADTIEIKRTALLYIGYLLFSFGFASLILFVLRGEEIRGWSASLGQLSMVSPVGYALLYAGRMPILLIIVLILAAIVVRIRQGRPALPVGHHLVLKVVILVLLFGIYTSAIWSRRHSVCVQTAGAFSSSEQKTVSPLAREGDGSGKKMSLADLNRIIAQATKSVTASGSPQPIELTSVLGAMNEWHVRPRGFVISAVKSGWLSSNAALSFLSSYFYLTHGVRVVDNTWHARELFSPHGGIYEIGVLSPIFRIFFPKSDQLASLGAQLKAAEIYGFFPTVWAASYIDFGLMGAVLYVLIWGFAAGWSAYGVRYTNRVMPALLLTFILASILLSPIQGPLGIANSALVLLSMLITGLAANYLRSDAVSRQPYKLAEPPTRN